jgi:hypothetical protein
VSRILGRLFVPASPVILKATQLTVDHVTFHAKRGQDRVLIELAGQLNNQPTKRARPYRLTVSASAG